MTGYLLEIGQALLALLLAPGLVGFIRMVKARLQGRRGAPPWQPYYDLRKLFVKEAVVSRNASWLFRFAPYLIFATTVAVTMLVPLIAAPLPFDAVGIATSLIIAGLLVSLSYAITLPLVTVSKLPTRNGIPLAVGLILVGVFVIISRRKALSQIVGFLVLENGIALLAALGTYGIPLIVELGVFLDALMGFLVMQILVYQIKDTFESIDVEQLSRLRH